MEHGAEGDKAIAVRVRIAPMLRATAFGKAPIPAVGRTVGEVLNDLESRCNGLKEQVCDESGIRKAVSIFLNGEDVRFLRGLDTPVKEGDELSIVSALAGG